MTSIAIASDHAGFEYKGLLKSHLESKGFKVRDFGTNSADPVDYPDFVRAAARSVAEGQHPLGIIVGGSGNEAIVANRLRGIRCAVFWNERTARLNGKGYFSRLQQRFKGVPEEIFPKEAR